MTTIEYRVEGKLACLALNRPEKMNAIDADMRTELWRRLSEIRDDPDVWVVIITGRGKAFSSGHDLLEPFSDAKPSFGDLYGLQTQIYKPIIAAVNGVCLAQGCGIALSSDICVASEHATFGWPQVKRGMSSVSGPAILARRVPLNKALEILFTGEPLTAQQALELGLVNYVVGPDELMPTAERIARKILENAPLAVWAMKEATLRTLSLRQDEAYKLANLLLRQVEATEDAQEGLRAFREKRAPVWRGR